MDLPTRFLARLAEGLQKTPAILIVSENGFPPIPPVHQMIDRAGILHSKLARHAAQALNSSRTVKHNSTIAGTDTFDLCAFAPMPQWHSGTSLSRQRRNDSTAQGNALGTRPNETVTALKGRNQRTRVVRPFAHASSGWIDSRFSCSCGSE
jgi:hypothetical protein